MKVVKRDGREVAFNPDKIKFAIQKAMEDVAIGTGNWTGFYSDLERLSSHVVAKLDSDNSEIFDVEEIQNLIEKELIESGFTEEARAFIRYRDKRTEIRNKGWELDELQKAIWVNKYQYDNETFDDWIVRVSGGDLQVAKLIRQKKFIFAGRILAHRGLGEKGKRVTYSNCYVMESPEDNLESIFETAKELARTYSTGGGCGVDISKLRPAGVPVNNSARTTSGAVSFMSLYDLTTGLIGQNGRRGALMLTIDVSHPDVEDFISIKTKPDSITKANISIKVSDEFMEAVAKNEPFTLHWEDDEGRSFSKIVDARELYMKNVKNNWDWAEAGFLFWDTIQKRHLMSNHPEHGFQSTNPCGEQPLMANGSCLLGSINLSEFVVHPFTDKAYFDMQKFNEAVKIGVRALNDVLDEGLPLHPLEGQKNTARDWRQIGLGIMGLADMMIKLGISYESELALRLSDQIGRNMVNSALQSSAMIAKEKGAFPKYNESALFKSEYFNKVATKETKDVVRKYGLRNSQILTIAPTGSISTMWGVSGGIEPIFAKSYKRKTESLYGEDVYYDVYTDIVGELMETLGTKDMPSYVVTSHDMNWHSRINMQSVWQTYIDASISSTVNLPKSATVDECAELFQYAWESGLKGVTIFRDGCKRTGILTVEDEKEEEKEPENNSYGGEDDKFTTCPECGEPIEVIAGACSICMNCGHSGCG